MFDISADKIIVVLVIALMVLGPGRLAEAARALGRARAQLRQFATGLSPETTKLIRDPRRAIFEAVTADEDSGEDKR